jgi:hypothetical protein
VGEGNPFRDVAVVVSILLAIYYWVPPRVELRTPKNS